MKTTLANSHPNRLRLTRCAVLLIALLTAVISSVHAATLRWTGGHATGANWSQGANWDTGTAPIDGDTVVFPAGAARSVNTNNIAGLQLVAIRFSGAGGGYDVWGNGVTLTNSLTATNSAGNNLVALDRITLGADLLFTVAQPGTTLFVKSEVRLNGHDLTTRTVGSLNVSGIISGAGNITKTDDGLMIVGGTVANSFTGDLMVNEGELRLNKLGGGLAVPGRLIVGDGIGGSHADVVLSQSDDQVNRVTVNASGYWDLGSTKDEVADLVLNAGGDVRTAPAGNLRLGIGADVSVTPSPLLLSDASRITGNLELLLGSHTFNIGEGSTLPSDATELIIEADITGLGGITKIGAGDMLLSGDNSFAAAVSVNDGELRISSDMALGTTLSGTTVNNDASLWLQGEVQVVGENLTLNSTGTTGGLNSRPALRASGLNNEWRGDVTFQSASRIGVLTNGFLNLSISMGGPGSLLKEDVGVLRFSGSDLSSFAGNVFVNAGVFELDHGFSFATLPANLGTIFVGDGVGGPHADVLQNLRSNQVGLNIPFGVPYAWPVVVNSSGLWDVNGQSDMVSLLALYDGGDVQTGANGIIAILIGLFADAGPEPDNDPARISGNVQFMAPSFPVVVQEGENSSGDASDLIIAANATGPGFTKSGTGDLLLANGNTFFGPITVNNGELRGGHADALGGNLDTVTVVSNATLWLQGDLRVGERLLRLDSAGQSSALNQDAALKVSGTNSWAGTVRLDRDTRIGVGPDSLLRLSGAITGPGGVVKEDPGVLTYAGYKTNTYTGTTTVAAGRLLLEKMAGANPFAGDLVVGNGLGGADADVVEFKSPGLNANESAVTVTSSGHMIVPEDASVGSIAGSGHLQVGAVLDVGRNGSSTQFDGPITGGGVINKFGNGALTLTGTNTVSGLVVFNGRLVANGNQPNTTIGVLGDAVLGGNGRVGAVLGLDGAIAPGESPGELRTGDLTLDSDVALRIELDGAAPVTGYDRLKVNGSVALGDARLNLTRGGAALAGQAFTIIENDGSDAVNGTFNGLAEGAVIESGSLRFSVSYQGGAGGNDVVLTAMADLPPCPEPVLSIHQLTNAVELSWPSCPSNFYQLEWTGNFQQWRTLTPPLAAPETNSIMTWTTPTSEAFQFFRLAIRPLTNAPVPTEPGIYLGRRLTHNGVTREYRINIPQVYTNGSPAPLMLALHGHNQTANEFASNVPSLATYANAGGVILVFPNGTDNSHGTGWNVLDPTPDNPVDDVGFLLALIDELDAALNIDRKRVYASGFSNGGQMCHRLAAKTTNVFAAFAAVGSAVAGEFGTGTLVYQPPPLEPLPVLIVNATNDCKRPFWGGLNMDGGLQPPARDSLTHWTNANLCTPSPIITTNVVVTNHLRRVFADCGGPYPPFNSPRTNLVIREHYQLTCTPGTEVQFVTLTDGGHAWVEAADNVGFDTSREVLEFFLRHCRCDTVGAEPLVIPDTPGRYELNLCDQGYSRLFRLQVPAGYNPAVPAPLAFVFHGGNQTVEEFTTLHPGLYTKANVENLLLVLPQATRHPMTRGTLWGDRPFDTVVDDVSFVTSLLEHLDATLNVDRLRIYAAGFSSGGEFSHWLGSTTTGLLAAIAPVCAQTGWNEPDAAGPTVTPPPPLEPIAVLLVRGGVDPRRPFNGGPNADGVLCRSASDDVAYWTAGSTCVGAPVVTAGAGVMQWEYSACAGTTEVILVRVDALGHAWPDSPPFNANVQVIDFLLTHSR